MYSQFAPNGGSPGVDPFVQAYLQASSNGGSLFAAYHTLPLKRQVSQVSIAPELNVLGSTSKERSSILTCFAVAAAAVCSAAVIAPHAVLAATVTVGFDALKAIVVLSLANRFLLTKADASVENAEKLRYLREKAKEQSARFGLSKVPEIRVWRTIPSFLGPAATFFFHKRFIVFDEKTLGKKDLPQLESVLGHEMAHVSRNHIWHRMGIWAAASTAAHIVVPLSLVTLPLLMLHSRVCEFQADRIGAVVSNKPQELADFLKQHYYRPSNVRWQEWRQSSLGDKILTAASSTILSPFKILTYALIASHPDSERRVERLENMAHPPVSYKSDSINARLKRLLP